MNTAFVFQVLHFSEISYQQQTEALLLYCSQETLPRGLQQKELQEKAGQQDLEEQEVIETGWIIAPRQGRMKTA